MSIYFYILIMAVTTYLIRMLPFTLFKKQIKNRRIKAFLHFVPYACLTVMTIPAILYATSSMTSAIIGLIVAIVLGFFGRSLPTVAGLSCVAVFIAERFLL